MNKGKFVSGIILIIASIIGFLFVVKNTFVDHYVTNFLGENIGSYALPVFFGILLILGLFLIVKSLSKK